MSSITEQKSVTIMYIEDDEINQFVIKNMLQSFGDIHVIIAGDAKTAFEYLKDQNLHISLILMDLGLPDIDGITLAAEIRKSDFSARDVPIIALTGNLASQAEEQCLDVGMNAFLTKPAEREKLLGILKQYINLP